MIQAKVAEVEERLSAATSSLEQTRAELTEAKDKTDNLESQLQEYKATTEQARAEKAEVLELHSIVLTSAIVRSF